MAHPPQRHITSAIVPPPPPIRTRTTLVKDTYIWRHFRHLPELPQRMQGVPWQVEYVTIGIADLYCSYPTPGEKEAPPGGLMGSVGWSPGSAAGRRIADMAAAITDAMRRITADLSNPVLKQVLDLRDRGIVFIRSRDEPLAFTVNNDTWCVREGVHRTVAMALAGATKVEAINLTSLRQATS